jgi:ATP diphosphatase
MDILKEIVAIDQEAQDFGFTWSHPSQLLAQIISECHEIEQEIQQGSPPVALQAELGDLMHATLSLCLYCGFDPQTTLTNSAEKFKRRFSMVKLLVQQSGLENLHQQPMEVLTNFWDQAKRANT